MANAATLLADLLVRWEVPEGQTPQSVRGGDPPNWDELSTALGYIGEIERHLHEMTLRQQEVSFYAPLLPKMTQSICGFEPEWSTVQNEPRPLLSPSELGLLRSLGQLIDVVPGSRPVSEDQRDALADRLDGLATEVAALDYLSEDLRVYLLSVLSNASAVLRSRATSDAGVRDAALVVAGSFVSVAEDTRVPEDKRSWWRDQATTISNGLITNLATTGITAGISVAAVRLLGS